jgi:hypothetical protein
MRALFEMVRKIVRWPFGSWTDFSEYLVFLGMCVAGVTNASWMWIVIGAMVLLLLGWSRWSALSIKAENIDAEYRALGRLAWERGVYEYVLRMFGNAYHLPFVLGAKVGLDALYLTGAFIFGHVSAWVWGVR